MSGWQGAPLTGFLTLPRLSVFPGVCGRRLSQKGKWPGWGSRLFLGLPAPVLAWGPPQPLCLDAFGLLQEETQGQEEEEEREAETHRLPPVSVRRRGQGMARRPV